MNVGTVMASRREVVEQYAAAFSTGATASIGECLTEDVTWELNGEQVGGGLEAYLAQIEKDLSTGRAEVTIEELVEDGDVLVALNRGRFVPHESDREDMPFVSAEAYTFSGDRISRIPTYQTTG